MPDASQPCPAPVLRDDERSSHLTTAESKCYFRRHCHAVGFRRCPDELHCSTSRLSRCLSSADVQEAVLESLKHSQRDSQPHSCCPLEVGVLGSSRLGEEPGGYSSQRSLGCGSSDCLGSLSLLGKTERCCGMESEVSMAGLGRGQQAADCPWSFFKPRKTSGGVLPDAQASPRNDLAGRNL
jgi:hypothetical protein